MTSTKQINGKLKVLRFHGVGQPQTMYIRERVWLIHSTLSSGINAMVDVRSTLFTFVIRGNRGEFSQFLNFIIFPALISGIWWYGAVRQV